MKVKLIASTNEPIDVMWTAARTCYASESPIDMWDKAYETYIDPDNVLTDACEKQEKAHWKLVQKVLNSGHMSIAEHVNFTFAIEGISRACSHQLVRHRHCTFSQQSQRYVEIKEDLESLLNLRDEAINNGCITSKSLINLLDKYFVGITEENAGAYLDCLIHYVGQTTQGKKPEDARNVLPNATKTNIVITTNLRNLIHICNLRLCVRAQKEIRELFKLIVQEVERQYPCFSNLLKAQCDTLGYCPEASKSCGRYKTLKQLTEKE